MPKPNLSSMSIDALLKLREETEEVLNRKAKELRSQLFKLGDTAERQRSSLRGKKVPPKYRSRSGETWAGRGARPRWLVAAIKGGKKIDEFLIDKGRKKRSR